MEKLLSQLQEIEAFAEVPESDLEWMIAKAECRNIETGGFIFEKDGKSDYLQIVLSGRFRVYSFQNGQKREFAMLVPGDVTGVLPYSRMTHAQGYGEALEPAEVMVLHRDHFPEMIREHHELTQAFVHLMTNRVRNYTTLQLQNEKLLALGKISAGLAHELNNPASAIVRSATSLREHLKALPEKFKAVFRVRMDEESVDKINGVLFEKLDAGVREDLSVLQRTELEDELCDWLEEHGVEDGLEIAENLVDFGFGPDDLESLRKEIPEEHWMAVLQWMADNLTTEKMVSEIAEASERIARLVQSVKEYSHMDQGLDKGRVDLRASIRSTLRMFEHRWKKANVRIEEDFDENLGEILAYPGELKQVWTNLLDNAIDALEGVGGGVIRIHSQKDGPFARLQIEDSGPGIPANVQSRIFDPFFTTKEIGKGTGLGLDVVMKIIQQHRGDIKFESEPGRTVFKLCFPID